MRTWCFAAAIAAGATSAAAIAQSPETDLDEEITVTASPLGDVFQPAWVLDDDALLQRRRPTLGETLEGELGVSSSYFGPASSRPVIRGLSGSRVTMLVDTLSSLDVADVSADHAVTIEPLLAESIEIIRGPASLLYGSTAAGGVVNVLDTRIPRTTADKALGGGVELRGDTAAEERAAVGRLDGGFGGFAWHVSAFDRETKDLDVDGFATADVNERSDEEVEGTLLNSYSESDGFSTGVSWVTERGYLGIAFSGIRNNYGLPGPEEEGEEEEEETIEGGPAGPFIDMEQNRIDIRGEYVLDKGWIESVSGAVARNDYEHAEFEPSGEVGTLFDNDASQLRFEAVHQPVGDWRGAFGFQLDQREFSAAGEEAFIRPTDTDSLGLFVVEELETAWGRVRLGGRLESMEHSNVDLAGYDENGLSFAAGAEIDVSEDYAVLVNLSRSERHPAAEELYANGPHLATRQFEVGLFALGLGAEKELSLNTELSLRRSGEGLNWSVSAYINQVDDFVFQNLTGGIEDGLPVAEYAQEDAQLIGVEAEAVLPLGSLAGAQTELRIFGDYVEAELDRGSYLPRIPPLRAGFSLSGLAERWRAALDVTYHGEQDNVTSFATDSFTMVDLYASVALERFSGVDLELFAKGANLLDEDARRSASFLAAFAPLPGRSFHFGGRLAF